jgi:benzoyl-CoA reductase/2-hydroxyglutaryl-CoA dehydratase subunit BcrC/BadD/HgdB
MSVGQTVRWLRQHNKPITRRNILNVWYMGAIPEDIDEQAEILADLEEELEYARRELN